MKRNMYSYLTTDQKARSSNLLGRAIKTPPAARRGVFLCCKPQDLSLKGSLSFWKKRRRKYLLP